MADLWVSQHDIVIRLHVLKWPATKVDSLSLVYLWFIEFTIVSRDVGTVPDF